MGGKTRYRPRHVGGFRIRIFAVVGIFTRPLCRSSRWKLFQSIRSNSSTASVPLYFLARARRNGDAVLLLLIGRCNLGIGSNSYYFAIPNASCWTDRLADSAA